MKYYTGASERGPSDDLLAVTPDRFACCILRERSLERSRIALRASDIALDIPDVRQYPASASFRVHRMSTVVMF
jgi:hypothetical protein